MNHANVLLSISFAVSLNAMRGTSFRSVQLKYLRNRRLLLGGANDSVEFITINSMLASNQPISTSSNQNLNCIQTSLRTIIITVVPAQANNINPPIYQVSSQSYPPSSVLNTPPLPYLNKLPKAPGRVCFMLFTHHRNSYTRVDSHSIF